jgi:chromosome segregation ATPase
VNEQQQERHAQDHAEIDRKLRDAENRIDDLERLVRALDQKIDDVEHKVDYG